MLPVGALTCALLWGSAFPAIKTSFQWIDGNALGDRVAFAGIRFTLAGLLLLVFVKKRGAYFRAAPKGKLAAVTLLQVVFQYLMFYWALALNSGVVSAILNATGSFWWVLLAPLVIQAASPTVKQLAILALGFAGVCLCVYSPGEDTQVSLVGSAMMLAATISATFATLLVKPLAEKVPPIFISGFSLFVGGVVLMAFSPLSVWRIVVQAGLPLIGMTFYLAFVSATAFSLWYTLVSRFEVAKLSGYRYLIPVCGVLESALFIPGETLGWATLLGGVLVLCSVKLLERSKVVQARNPLPIR